MSCSIGLSGSVVPTIILGAITCCLTRPHISKHLHRHDITEILLKVILNIITLNKQTNKPNIYK